MVSKFHTKYTMRIMNSDALWSSVSKSTNWFMNNDVHLQQIALQLSSQGIIGAKPQNSLFAINYLDQNNVHVFHRPLFWLKCKQCIFGHLLIFTNDKLQPAWKLLRHPTPSTWTKLDCSCASSAVICLNLTCCSLSVFVLFHCVWMFHWLCTVFLLSLDIMNLSWRFFTVVAHDFIAHTIIAITLAIKTKIFYLYASSLRFNKTLSFYHHVIFRRKKNWRFFLVKHMFEKTYVQIFELCIHMSTNYGYVDRFITDSIESTHGFDAMLSVCLHSI